MLDTQEMGAMPRWLIITTVVVPVSLILGVLLVINYPKWVMEVQYDFAYATCDSFSRNISSSADGRSTLWVSCGDFLSQRFVVVDGALEVRDDLRLLAGPQDTRVGATEPYQADEIDRLLRVRLFVHDVETNVSIEIEPEELAGRRIISTRNAPDGTRLESRRVSQAIDPFYFFTGGRSYQVNEIVKDNIRKEIDVHHTVTGQQFHLLGWLER